METPSMQVQGKGVHAGCVQGCVRMVSALQDARTLQQGDVLIVPMLSPMWLPFIRKASAIVVESGGITSPIATVLREFTVPAIVGAKGVMSVFREGDLVEVDADKGSVRCLV